MKFTLILIGIFLVNIVTFTCKATSITRIIYEPEVSFSANGRHRFTLVDACEKIQHFDEYSKKIYFEIISGTSKYQEKCENFLHVFIGEFADLEENGNWRIVWKKIFTDGLPGTEFTDKWIIDDDGEFIVGDWFEDEENIVSIDREGNIKEFPLIKSLMNAKLISSKFEYNFINWLQRDLWNRHYKISNDKKFIIIEMNPAENNIIFEKNENFIVSFSLGTGEFIVNQPQDWQSMRRTINCNLLPKKMESLIDLPGAIIHEDGSITHDLTLMGFNLLIYKIKTKIKYEYIYTKSALSQIMGNSCI